MPGAPHVQRTQGNARDASSAMLPPTRNRTALSTWERRWNRPAAGANVGTEAAAADEALLRVGVILLPPRLVWWSLARSSALARAAYGAAGALWRQHTPHERGQCSMRAMRVEEPS